MNGSYFLKTLLSFLWPGNILSSVRTFLRLLNMSNFGDKVLLCVLFAPAFSVLGYVLLYIVWLLIFTLPSLILRIFGSFIAFTFLWYGAVWVYEKLRGPLPRTQQKTQSTYSYSKWVK